MSSTGFTKRLEFSTQNSLGQHFAEAIDITPRNWGLTKIAGSLHPEIAAFLKNLKPDPRYQYVLMTPMGAFEYWGMNCLPAGTPIHLADGEEVPVEEIEIGDEVLTHTGASRKVSKVFRGIGDGMVSLKIQGQVRSLDLTPGHPVYAVRKEDFVSAKRKFIWKQSGELSDRKKSLIRSLEPQWIDAGDLAEGDYVFLPFPTQVEETPELSEPGMATLLGWYAAEGTIARRKRKDRKGEPWQDHQVILTLGLDDPVDAIVDLLYKRGLSPRVLRHYQGASVTRVEIFSQRLARICREHIGKGSKNKRLSPEILRMPIEWQKEFFTAYLNGDGCFRQEGKEAGSVRISTASEAMATDLRLLAARFGMVTSSIRCKQHHSSIAPGNTIFEFRVPASQWSGGEDRTESLIDDRGFIIARIKEIQHDESWVGPVFNFEVEEDNSYVASGVVVHNSNGDIFPRISLAYDMFKDDPAPVAKALENRWLAHFGKHLPPGNYREFGHKTFLNANRYRHHQNKDPSKSYGGIVCAAWSSVMQRAELIVRHDREAAKRVGAEDIVQDIDEGKPRQISMGCRVSFDVCTVCGHISRTPVDYCIHLKTQMGSILENGAIVGAVNFFPRFFDLSDVFVPAAKESGTLMKVAHARGFGVKTAVNKQAEITKKLIPNVGHETLKETISREPDLPKHVLGGGPDFKSLLTTLAALGILLKPHEYQYSALSHSGMGSLADLLDSRRQVFSPERPSGFSSFDEDGFSSSLASRLLPFLSRRSGLYPHLPERMIRIIVIRAPAPPEREKVANNQILQKIAESYASYRLAFRELPKLLDQTIELAPGLYSKAFFGELLTDSMAKVASSSHALVLPDSPTALYFYNAHREHFSPLPDHWQLEANSTSPARALLRPVL